MSSFMMTEWQRAALAEGKAIRVMVANFYGYTEEDVKRFLDAGCTRNENGCYGFVAHTVDEFEKAADKLDGFTMGGWSYICEDIYQE